MKNDFLAFLDPEQNQEHHGQEYDIAIDDMLETGSKRISINLNHLRGFIPPKFEGNLAESILKQPEVSLPPLEDALKSIAENKIQNQDVSLQKEAATRLQDSKEEKWHVAIEGSFGTHHGTPRGMNSRLLSKMVCIDGIVTKCSLVRPKVVRSVHYCPETKKILKRVYRDATSLDGPPTTTAYPTKDENGNPLETEYGECEYKDYQTITLQEMPESAPPLGSCRAR